MTDDNLIKKTLDSAKTIAMIGASTIKEDEAIAKKIEKLLHEPIADLCKQLSFPPAHEQDGHSRFFQTLFLAS